MIFFLTRGDGLLGWFNWIIGNGTYLYYLSILIICYFLLFYYSNNKAILISAISLNIISLLLTSFGYLDQLSSYFDFRLNNYLNIFNWIGFFSLGILAKDWLSKFLYNINKLIVPISILYLFCLFLSLKIEPNYGGYFSKIAIPMEIIGATMILSFSTLNIFNKSFILEVSKYTFAIYLTHFLIFPIKKYWVIHFFLNFSIL